MSWRGARTGWVDPVAARIPPELSVPCPKCQAEPGFKCVPTKGWPGLKVAHAERKQAYLAARLAAQQREGEGS
jgi:hypothetical protein